MLPAGFRPSIAGKSSRKSPPYQVFNPFTQRAAILKAVPTTKLGASQAKLHS